MVNLAYEKIKMKRLTVLNKFGQKCAYCGCELELSNFHMDHIKPKLRGELYYKIPFENRGHDNIENLFPSCGSCNCSKGTMSLEQFREHISDRLYRLNTHSSHYQIVKRFGLIAETNKEIIFYFETLPDNA